MPSFFSKKLTEEELREKQEKKERKEREKQAKKALKKSKKNKQTEELPSDNDSVEFKERERSSNDNLSEQGRSGSALLLPLRASARSPKKAVDAPSEYDVQRSQLRDLAEKKGRANPRAGEFSGFERNSSYSSQSGDSEEYVSRAVLDAAAEAEGTTPRPRTVVIAPRGSPDRSEHPPAVQKFSPEGKRVDHPDVVVHAVRYAYNVMDKEWEQQLVQLRILHPNRGVAQDRFHVYFACDLLLLKDSPLQRAFSARGRGPGGRSMNDRATTMVGGQELVSDTLSPEVMAPALLNPQVAKSIPMLIRMFRHNISKVTDDDYYGEGQCQAIAESLAYKFNRFPVPPDSRKLPLPLLTNRSVVRIDALGLPRYLQEERKGFFSYRTTDSRDVVMLLEPDVRECAAVGVSFSFRVPAAGSVKPLASRRTSGAAGSTRGSGKQAGAASSPAPVATATTTAGKRPSLTDKKKKKAPKKGAGKAGAGADGDAAQGIEEDDVYPAFDASKHTRKDLKEVADAFSHFSFEQSKGRLLVNGLVHSHRYLLDPIVTTADGEEYGMSNAGAPALRYWAGRHKCGALCQAYALEPPSTYAANIRGGPSSAQTTDDATSPVAPPADDADSGTNNSPLVKSHAAESSASPNKPAGGRSATGAAAAGAGGSPTRLSGAKSGSASNRNRSSPTSAPSGERAAK